MYSLGLSSRYLFIASKRPRETGQETLQWLHTEDLQGVMLSVKAHISCFNTHSCQRRRPTSKTDWPRRGEEARLEPGLDATGIIILPLSALPLQKNWTARMTRRKSRSAKPNPNREPPPKTRNPRIVPTPLPVTVTRLMLKKDMPMVPNQKKKTPMLKSERPLPTSLLPRKNFQP